MMEKTLLAAAIVVVVLVVVAMWPVHSRAIAGFWQAPDGSLYEIRPSSSYEFIVIPPVVAHRWSGRISGSLIEIGGGTPRTGRLDPSGRRIVWGTGEKWALQGVSKNE